MIAPVPNRLPVKAFVIGHPVAHSRSPLIHGHWLAEHAIAGFYGRIDVPPPELERFVASFAEQGFAGGNVTVPHKEAVLRHVDAVSDVARRLGAVNTLSLRPDGRILGHNTDGAGFLANLDEALGTDWDRETGTALVIGAGGAARAVVVALLDRGFGRILVANRTRDRTDELVALGPDRIRAVDWRDLTAATAEAGLLVNTTSLGMSGQPPLDLSVMGLPERAIVTDIVYVPLVTPLLAAAAARGLRTVGGLGMLLHQAVPGFASWFGTTPAVTAELRAAIEADIGRPPASAP